MLVDGVGERIFMHVICLHGSYIYQGIGILERTNNVSN